MAELHNPWSFVLKEKQDRDVKTTWRPQSLMRSFCLSISRGTKHGVRAVWHGYATIRKTLPNKWEKEKIKRGLHWWSMVIKNVNFAAPHALVQVPPCLSRSTLDLNFHAPDICLLTQLAPHKWTAGSMGLCVGCFETRYALEQRSANCDP